MNKVIMTMGLLFSVGLVTSSEARRGSGSEVVEVKQDQRATSQFIVLQQEKENTEGLLNSASNELFNTELFKHDSRGTVGGIKKELKIAVKTWNDALSLVGIFIARRAGADKDPEHLQLARYMHELSIESHKLTHLVTVINNAFMVRAAHKMHDKKLDLEGYKHNLQQAQDNLGNLSTKVSAYVLDNESIDFNGKQMAKSLIMMAFKYLESGAATAIQAVEREME